MYNYIYSHNVHINMLYITSLYLRAMRLRFIKKKNREKKVSRPGVEVHGFLFVLRNKCPFFQYIKLNVYKTIML